MTGASTTTTSNDDRPYDVVLYGATSFVGVLVARYLAGHAPEGLRVALAGRSREKLERVRAELPLCTGDWPLLVADAADRGALADLAGSARVVATTVGPYARHGLPLVEACAAAGTHYADLTGETTFVRAAADAFDAAAKASGARLVHACGFDSVPSDLGVLLLHQRAAADGAGDLAEVRLVATARGGFSGGTVASGLGQIEAALADPGARRLFGDPYALSPRRAEEPDVAQPSTFPAPGRRGPGGTWTGPFTMAGFNTVLVRRSNALLGWAYGRDLRYGESAGHGRGPRAPLAAATSALSLVAAGIGMVAGTAIGPARPLRDRLLPAPGTGPDEEQRRTGWFRMDLVAVTTSGRRYRGKVAAWGDPGYAATAVMLGESALCLALDGDRLPGRTGSLTPATAMGAVLADRLRAAGHTYTVAAA